VKLRKFSTHFSGHIFCLSDIDNLCDQHGVSWLGRTNCQYWVQFPFLPSRGESGGHDAGPYYVFTSGVHTRHDIRVLAPETAPKKANATSTRRTYPEIQKKLDGVS